MTLEEAIKHAEQSKSNGICSTSGKALVALLDALNEANKEIALLHQESSNSGEEWAVLLRKERDSAINMLAGWCAAITHNGTGWDDWDEWYKEAAYRPCFLRVVLDEAIAKHLEEYRDGE